MFIAGSSRWSDEVSAFDQAILESADSAATVLLDLETVRSMGDCRENDQLILVWFSWTF
jgi:hypothetical protein